MLQQKEIHVQFITKRKSDYVTMFRERERERVIRERCVATSK